MKFKILCEKGDEPYDYDTETAAIKFDELKDQNLLPVAVTAKGNKVVKDFDPNADEIMWVPAIAGG